MVNQGSVQSMYVNNYKKGAVKDVFVVNKPTLNKQLSIF